MLGLRRSGEFQAFLRLVQRYFNDVAEMRHCELTSVVGRTGLNRFKTFVSLVSPRRVSHRLVGLPESLNREIKLTEACRIGKDVNLDDSSTRHRERHKR